MNYCFQHNKDEYHIKFNENSILEFQILIDECLSNNSYITTINNILKKIDKLNKEGIFENMRMTIIEL